MSKIVKYKFNITAVSPLFFGDSKPGEIIMGSDNKPIIMGNSLGGAFRDFLKKKKVDEETILKFMGGDDTSNSKETENTFQESCIFISDGKFIANKNIDGNNDSEDIRKVKEGTAIDAEYGSAKDKQKYSLRYLPENIEFEFCVELDSCSLLRNVIKEQKQALEEKDKLEIEQEILKDFEKIIVTWAKGIYAQELLLGGQKNNGFGRFKIKEIQKAECEINSTEDLDIYIARNNRKENYQKINWQNLDSFNTVQNVDIPINMHGEFSYGLYQGYFVKTEDSENKVTGIQMKYSAQAGKDVYYLPASSIKGVVRNEISILLKRMITDNENEVEKKCNELLGGTEQRGKIQFTDVEIVNGEKVQIERYERIKDKENKSVIIPKEGNPKYIKIDRLTGGAYDSALKEQQEIQGHATIQLKLNLDDMDRENKGAYLFCLIYVMRRIGSGIVPLGGRTSIGLGQLFAEYVNVGKETAKFETSELHDNSRNVLQAYFDAFKRWCC